MQDNVNTKIDFGSESFKKYFANTSWLFGEKAIRLVVAAIISIFIARYLGPGDFGILNYAISFVGLFAAVATFGLDNILIRELVKQPEKRDYLIGTVFYLRLIGAVLSLLFLLIGLQITGDDHNTVIIVLIISASTFFQAFYVIEFYFHSRVQGKYISYVYLVSLFLGSAIKITLIFFNAPLMHFAVITSFEFLIIATGLVAVYQQQKLDLFNWRFDKSIAFLLLKDSWPLLLSGLVIAVYMKIGQVMIKNMLTNEAVGLYSVAVRLSESWFFIPMAIVNSLFPAILNAKASGEELYKSRMQKLYDLLAWIAIAIALPTTFLSGFIINILFGVKYVAAAPVLTIYIWTGVAVFLGVASSQYLVAENMTRLSFFRTFTGMIVNVILNYLLIPKYGITGSALASLISYSAATFSIAFSKKTYHQFTMMVKSMLFINLFKFLFKQWQYRSVKN